MKYLRERVEKEGRMLSFRARFFSSSSSSSCSHTRQYVLLRRSVAERVFQVKSIVYVARGPASLL